MILLLLLPYQKPITINVSSSIMKLSEFLTAEPAIREELPAALERAYLPLPKEDADMRLPFIDGKQKTDAETFLIVKAFVDNPDYEPHTHVVSLECMRFNSRRLLPIMFLQFGITEVENGPVIYDKFKWWAGATGVREIDVETLAATQRIADAYQGLHNLGIVEVTYINEAFAL